MEEIFFDPALRLSVFARLGFFAFRYRRVVIAVWGLLLVVSFVLIPRLDTVLKGIGAVYEQGEAIRTERLLSREVGFDADVLTAVFQSSEGDLGRFRPQIDRNTAEIRSLAEVKSVVCADGRTEYRSADGRTEYCLVSLKVKDSQAFGVSDRIEGLLASSSGLQTYLTGKPLIDRDGQRISQTDLRRVELLALPLILLALLFVFGSVVAASVPIVMGIMAVVVTYGALSLLAVNVDLSVFALNLTTMLGLGLGIDYSLLIVNRFREEISVSSVESAVIRTVDTAGRAVFFSGLTVGIGLLSLLSFPILLLRSLGIAGSLVVLLSVAAALTLVPALLGVLGSSINRGRIFRKNTSADGAWGAIAQTIMQHSPAAVAFVLTVVFVLTSPFFQARFGLGDASVLPKGVRSRQGIEVLQQSFGRGATSPILLAISTLTPGDRILEASHLLTLDRFVKQLQSDSRIQNVTSLVNLSSQFSISNYQQLYSHPELLPPGLLKDAVGRLSSRATTLVVLKSYTDSNSEASRNLVQKLKTLSLDGLRLQVGGQTADQLDIIQAVQERFPFVLAGILLVTFAVLCILLGSVVLPIKAILMNLLSMGASFGALVFIFQEGHFQHWLDFQPLGYLDILIAVVLFCVLFGLSMDYEVFLLCRIKEAYDRTYNNRLSVIEGVARTGRIITSAALLLMIVTGAFALTSIIFVKALGLGVAIGVLIDATLIRTILVPATMHLLGHWNWWSPRFMHLERFKFRAD